MYFGRKVIAKKETNDLTEMRKCLTQGFTLVCIAGFSGSYTAFTLYKLA